MLEILGVFGQSGGGKPGTSLHAAVRPFQRRRERLSVQRNTSAVQVQKRDQPHPRRAPGPQVHPYGRPGQGAVTRRLANHNPLNLWNDIVGLPGGLCDEILDALPHSSLALMDRVGCDRWARFRQ